MATHDQAWLSWHFLMVRGKQAWTLRGATHLTFDEAGRISCHRDYWDPVEELYAKLPILGPLMRGLTRLLAARPQARHQ